MTTDPLVTVLLPVYNGEPYISDAVRSMSAQTYENLDILVIDDGSTDGTLAVLRRLQANDPRIRIVSRENRGLIRTLNEGLSLARGSLIARMDADDISYPARIEQQVSRFRRNGNIAICSTHIDYIVAQNRIMKFNPPQIALEEIATYNIFDVFFVHSTVMLNKKIFDERNYIYDERYKNAEDFELFSKVSRHHEVDFIQDPLLAIRINHVSTQSLYPQQCAQVYHRIICRNIKMAGVDVDQEAVERLMAPGRDFTEADIEVAREYLEAGARVRDHVDSRSEVFDAAYDVFVSHLFESLALKADPRMLAVAFRSAGVFQRLRARSKLLTFFAYLLSRSRALSIRGSAVRISQLMRSRRFRIPSAMAES